MSINWAMVLHLKFTLTNFTIGATTNDSLSKHQRSIVLRLTNIQHIPYECRVSLNYTLETYINHVQGPFPFHIVQIFGNSSDVSRWAFHATQNERSAPRFVPRARHVSLWIFGHTGGVRQFSPAFYRWLLPNNSRFYRWSSLTNQKFLSEH